MVEDFIVNTSLNDNLTFKEVVSTNKGNKSAFSIFKSLLVSIKNVQTNSLGIILFYKFIYTSLYISVRTTYCGHC